MTDMIRDRAEAAHLAHNQGVAGSIPAPVKGDTNRFGGACPLS